MDTVEFYRELRRMCKTYGSVTCCGSCPISVASDFCDLAPMNFKDETIDFAVKVVEQWAKDHPVITNAKKFEEVFGFNPIGYVFRGEFSDAWWGEEYKESKE